MALNTRITEFQLYNKTKLVLLSSGKIIHKRKNDSLEVSIQELSDFTPCITKVRIYKENSVDQEILRKLNTKNIINVYERLSFNSVSLGKSHSLILRNGEAFSFGENIFGELGDGTTTDRCSPIQIGGVLVGKEIVSISVGYKHSLALDSDRKVYAWGWNSYGKLGDGTTFDRHSPIQVSEGSILEGKNIISVSAGYEYSLALDSDGNVYAWGWNGYGQLGDGTTTEKYPPIQVGGALVGKEIVSISAGLSHSLALDSDGNVYAWGWNSSPIQIGGALVGKDITSVSAGDSRFLALDLDGNVYTWGDNLGGKLGDGTTTTRHSPTKINLNN